MLVHIVEMNITCYMTKNIQLLTNLWVVLSIPGMQGNLLEVKLTAEVHRGNNVPRNKDIMIIER